MIKINTQNRILRLNPSQYSPKTNYRGSLIQAPVVVVKK
jgi:hypothetical protein